MDTNLAPILLDLPDELVGERVLVRPLRPGDGPALWQSIDESREQLSPWLPWVEKTLESEDAEATVRRACAKWLMRTDLMVGIWEQATGQHLGGSGLHRIDWDVPAFEIGYWLRTSAWGSGYVSEAVRLLCGMAFETLQANRVEIRCDGHNTRSSAVAQRLGFVQEATLRNHCRDGNGALRDTLIFAMIPEDYARIKAVWEQEGKSR